MPRRTARAYCDLLQPSTFLDSFNSEGPNVRTETNQILEQAGEQPELEVEDITIDGDTAKVSFVGRSGEAPFVKENDNWYLALGQGTAAPGRGRRPPATTAPGTAAEDGG